MTGKNLIQALSKTKISDPSTKRLIGLKLVSEFKKSNSNKRSIEIASVAYMLDVPQLNFFINKIPLTIKFN